MSCIIREPLNPCHDHDKITPIKLHERCQVHVQDSSGKSPSESTQDFELPSSDGSSRNTAVTHTEGLREDDSTSKLLNDEKISQHLVESIEASTFEQEQDLLHVAFKELEVRLIIFDISVKIAIYYFQLFLMVQSNLDCVINELGDIIKNGLDCGVGDIGRLTEDDSQDGSVVTLPDDEFVMDVSSEQVSNLRCLNQPP